MLTVIDILNKFIVFSSEKLEPAIAIFIEFGTCFIITANKMVYRLEEKDLQRKLKSLFDKKLYDIAVRIAKSNQYDLEGLADIFKQYGDHLYQKGDYAGTIQIKSHIFFFEFNMKLILFCCYSRCCRTIYKNN